jgi:hypothetical protein
MIRGAILYECRALPSTERPCLGAIHPLVRALEVGSLKLSEPYRKYSLRIGGCNAAGQFVSTPLSLSADAENQPPAADVFEPLPSPDPQLLLEEADEVNTQLDSLRAKLAARIGIALVPMQPRSAALSITPSLNANERLDALRQRLSTAVASGTFRLIAPAAATPPATPLPPAAAPLTQSRPPQHGGEPSSTATAQPKGACLEGASPARGIPPPPAGMPSRRVLLETCHATDAVDDSTAAALALLTEWAKPLEPHQPGGPCLAQELHIAEAEVTYHPGFWAQRRKRRSDRRLQVFQAKKRSGLDGTTDERMNIGVQPERQWSDWAPPSPNQTASQPSQLPPTGIRPPARDSDNRASSAPSRTAGPATPRGPQAGARSAQAHIQGLPQLGNTCWRASALQLLRPLRHRLANREAELLQDIPPEELMTHSGRWQAYLQEVQHQPEQDAATPEVLRLLQQTAGLSGAHVLLQVQLVRCLACPTERQIEVELTHLTILPSLTAAQPWNPFAVTTGTHLEIRCACLAENAELLRTLISPAELVLVECQRHHDSHQT